MALSWPELDRPRVQHRRTPRRLARRPRLPPHQAPQTPRSRLINCRDGTSITNSAGNQTQPPPSPLGLGGRSVSIHTLRRTANKLWWFVLIAAVIGSLTPKSNDSVAQFRDAHDGFLHTACYAAITGLRALDSRRRQILLFLAAATLGIAIELIQPFVGRAFDWIDIRDNTIGLLLGLVAAAVIRTQIPHD